MTRALAAAVLLFTLNGCGLAGADPAAKPASQPAAGKPLPPAPPPPPLPDKAGACAADVKQCADGSYVSRNPDNDCAFDACPGANNH
ncbi:hypothetical protein [Thiobacillus denitrificans]|jgi:hypothetical protein|uniref:hypothetical protein n=1 Tax=Thiobacillus denitrificans TaxID=36861 RepID=UPI0004765E11|nr:hypothetical protein [Thiobacillus denitrificans]